MNTNDSKIELKNNMDLKRRFAVLAENWQKERQCCPTVLKMVMLPSYQQIIGMGKEAVPLILQELRKAPDHWFWALKAITGHDPVLENQRGNILKMTAAWIKWGESQGISN